MELSRFKEIWREYENTYPDHLLSFPDWCEAMGYQLESYVQAEDETKQALRERQFKEWEKKHIGNYRAIFRNNERSDNV